MKAITYRLLPITPLVPNNYEIRAVRESETDAMLSLMCRCFGLEPSSAAPIFRADPFFDLNLKRVVIERGSGRILSCLTLVPTKLTLSSGKAEPNSFLIGGIAGVCTEPEFRGMGLASLLLERTAIDARTLGFAATALTAERPDYYIKRGWSAYGDACDWCSPAGFFDSISTDNLSIHLASMDESTCLSSDIHALYERLVSDSVPGSFARSDKKWTAIEKLSIGRRVLAAVDGQNELIGYAAYDIRQSEVGTTAFVHEIVTADEGHIAPMLSFFNRNNIADFVASRSRPHEVAGLGLLGNPDIKVTSTPGAYIRVTDPQIASSLDGISPFLGIPDMF